MSGVKPRHRSEPAPAAVAAVPDPKKLRVVEYPAAVLHKKASEVTAFTAELSALAGRMFELMREQKGVGLAAPQVGVGLRLFVCNPTGEPNDDLVCVNPKFLELSGAEEKPEGCLSLPEVTVVMRRATKAVVEAFDLSGKRFAVEGVDLRARVWQHEMDHLDGKLIIDNMSETDAIANRRALKELEGKVRPAKRR